MSNSRNSDPLEDDINRRITEIEDERERIYKKRLEKLVKASMSPPTSTKSQGKMTKTTIAHRRKSVSSVTPPPPSVEKLLSTNQGTAKKTDLQPHHDKKQVRDNIQNEKTGKTQHFHSAKQDDYPLAHQEIQPLTNKNGAIQNQSYKFNDSIQKQVRKSIDSFHTSDFSEFSEVSDSLEAAEKMAFSYNYFDTSFHSEQFTMSQLEKSQTYKENTEEKPHINRNINSPDVLDSTPRRDSFSQGTPNSGDTSSHSRNINSYILSPESSFSSINSKASYNKEQKSSHQIDVALLNRIVRQVQSLIRTTKKPSDSFKTYLLLFLKQNDDLKLFLMENDERESSTKKIEYFSQQLTDLFRCGNPSTILSVLEAYTCDWRHRGQLRSKFTSSPQFINGKKRSSPNYEKSPHSDLHFNKISPNANKNSSQNVSVSPIIVNSSLQHQPALNPGFTQLPGKDDSNTRTNNQTQNVQGLKSVKSFVIMKPIENLTMVKQETAHIPKRPTALPPRKSLLSNDKEDAYLDSNSSMCSSILPSTESNFEEQDNRGSDQVLDSVFQSEILSNIPEEYSQSNSRENEQNLSNNLLHSSIESTDIHAIPIEAQEFDKSSALHPSQIEYKSMNHVEGLHSPIRLNLSELINSSHSAIRIPYPYDYFDAPQMLSPKLLTQKLKDDYNLQNLPLCRTIQVTPSEKMMSTLGKLYSNPSFAHLREIAHLSPWTSSESLTLQFCGTNQQRSMLFQCTARSIMTTLKSITLSYGISSSSDNFSRINLIRTLIEQLCLLEQQLHVASLCMDSFDINNVISGMISPSLSGLTRKDKQKLLETIFENWGPGLPLSTKIFESKHFYLLGVGMVFL